MNPRNKAFSEALAKRGLTVDALASMIFSGRSHLTQVLRGSRNGTRTWNKLARVLSVQELALAMEFANLRLGEGKLRVQLKRIKEGDPVLCELVSTETGLPVDESENVPRRTKTKFSLFSKP